MWSEGHLTPLWALVKGVGVRRVRFLSDWSHEQDGDIRAGEQLWIEYDRSRFREPPELIRLRQQAAAAYFYLLPETWPIIVYARFYPDGQEKAFPMEIYGKSVEGGLNIPTGANKIELWFQYADLAKYTDVVAWDSLYGQNYWFDVT